VHICATQNPSKAVIHGMGYINPGQLGREFVIVGSTIYVIDGAAKQKKQTMFQRIAIAVRKWLALRSFPHGKPQSSYALVDFFSPYGGLHDRVMIYKRNGSVSMHFKSNYHPTGKDGILVRTTVTVEALNALFAWMDDRLPKDGNMRLSIVHKDPAQLTIFAFNSEKSRTYSVCVYDTRSSEEFRSFRGEIIEMVKRMSPLAFPQ
jgi:hypothetical protein